MLKSTSNPDPVSALLEPGFCFCGPTSSILPKPLIDLGSSFHFPPIEPGSDRYWMLEALKTSLSGIGSANPNPSVGCVIVDRSGKEISRGFTQPYPGCHAEKMAFDNIRNPELLNQATLYVTLEPCCHFGNQPPCVDLIINSGIRKIVIAREDPNPRVNRQGIQKLKEAGKQVEVGLFQAEATAWNFGFFGHQIFKRPMMILKWAQTLDGQLADDTSSSQWISGPSSRAYAHWLRQRYDAVLVGSGTLLADFPRLNVRKSVTPSPTEPLPILFDPSGNCLRVDQSIQDRLNETILHNERTIIVIVSEQALKKSQTSWLAKRKNVHFLTIPGIDPIAETYSILNQEEISKILGRPFQSVLIEGGPKTLTSFLKAGYGDVFHVFIAPMITGGHKNRIFLLNSLNQAKRLKLIASSRFHSDILVEMVTEEVYQKIFS